MDKPNVASTTTNASTATKSEGMQDRKPTAPEVNQQVPSKEAVKNPSTPSAPPTGAVNSPISAVKGADVTSQKGKQS